MWALWSVVIVLGFALLYTPADSAILFEDWRLPRLVQDFFLEHGARLEAGGKPLDFWSSFRFSVATLGLSGVIVGDGGITPMNSWAKGFVVAEVILGFVMLGGLIAIFTNKIARRS